MNQYNKSHQNVDSNDGKESSVSVRGKIITLLLYSFQELIIIKKREVGERSRVYEESSRIKLVFFHVQCVLTLLSTAHQRSSDMEVVAHSEQSVIIHHSDGVGEEYQLSPVSN